jgi:hypothetical protein
MGIECRFEGGVAVVTGPLIFTALAMIWRLGFDGFTELAGHWGFAAAGPRESWLRHLERICALLDDYSRVEEAFDGIRVLGPRENVFVKSSAKRLPYKSTEDHYPNRPGSIFR